MVRARVTFLRTEEGGRLNPAADGYRPHIQLDTVMTSCIVHSRPPGMTFVPGQPYEVDLEPVFQQYADQFTSSTTVRLYEGSKLVATGEYLSST